MDREALALPRLDRVIWGIVATTAVIVVAAPVVSDFHIAWQTFAPAALACLVLFAAGCFYSRWRTDPRLAAALLSTAQVIALAAVGVPLSYIAASANIPLYVNTAMLVATPIDGSHYFIDVLAGIALGALSLTVARAMAARATSHLAPHAGEMAQSAQA